MGAGISLGVSQIVTGIAIITGRQAIDGATAGGSKKSFLLRKTTWAGLGLIVTGMVTIVAGLGGSEALEGFSG